MVQQLKYTLYDNAPIYYQIRDGAVYYSAISLQQLFIKDRDRPLETLPSDLWFKDGQDTFLKSSVLEKIRDRFGDNASSLIKHLESVQQQNTLALELSFLGQDIPINQSYRDIKYDYCNGLRVQVPDNYTTTIVDQKTLYSFEETGSFETMAKYYVPWDFTVKDETGAIVLHHTFSLKDKRICIIGSQAIGDSLAWLPHIVEFGRQHQVGELITSVTSSLVPIIQDYYKDTSWLTIVGYPVQIDTTDLYACYKLGAVREPRYRKYLAPNNHIGLPLEMIPVRYFDVWADPIKLTPKKPSPIKEPYVCISTMATNYSKHWNNPVGWRRIVSFLKELGYKVVCIDQSESFGIGRYQTVAPGGCIDLIGDYPLQDRIDVLADADFFIGISSGMSWLARAVNCPVIMISGVTDPNDEFPNPYRVWNPHVCFGCFTDGDPEVNSYKYGFCKYTGTEREYECTKKISEEYVKKVILQLMKDHNLDPKKG